MHRRGILAVVFICTIPFGVQAARLVEVEGNVLVNKGEGFWEVSGATAVSAGDRVVVRGKGAAKIDYGNGCVKTISANQTTVVASKPICDAMPVVAQKPPIPTKFAGSLRAAAGAPALTGGLPEDDAALIGGAVAVVAGTIGLASRDHDGSKYRPDEPSDTKANNEAARAPAAFNAASNFDTAESDKRIAVLDNMVIVKTEAADTAMHGGDTTDGSPASP